MWWEGHITKDTAQVFLLQHNKTIRTPSLTDYCGPKVRIKLDGPKASAVLVGNILHAPPAAGEAAMWQPLLLEVHHHDDKGRLHTISLLPDEEEASSPPDAAMQVTLAMK
jgi:hypothetical protein